MRKVLFLLVLGLLQSGLHAEWRGNLALESRFFLEDASQGQDDQQYSLKVEPEYFYQGDDSLFTFQFLARKDSMDGERTHADIRELNWLTYGDDWELKLGVSKVFWGVAESQHLVDIINQTDTLENVDSEDKLGQPMINYTKLNDWGNLSVFVMPYFREREFAGIDGRFRVPFVIDTDLTTYDSSDEDKNIDVAVRWSHTLGDWDIGVAHFSGTSREPNFNPAISGNQVVLAPHYSTIDQTSLDLQATLDSWLWKLEMISNSGFHSRRYTAAVFGFEYSFYDVAESGIDVGMIMEYQFDDRKTDLAGTPILDSLVLGSRIAWNDEESTEMLVGIGINEEQDMFWNIEASRRLDEYWKLSVEARLLTNIDDSNPTLSPFYAIRDDSFIQIELARYF